MSTPERIKGRIIIGEDVRVIAARMTDALKSAGYEVEVAGDGEECLRKARETVPDLAILDIMMPRMHGIDVLKALREDFRTSKIGVLICTAKDFKTEHSECVRLGAFDVLIKPFEPEQLIAKVESYFNRSSRPSCESSSSRRVAGTGARPREPFEAVLDASHGCFSLWGTRGSTPTPGGRFLRHGGNTSCMSVVFGDEQFIFDAGSGIRDLGIELLSRARRRLHLFITHTHWDHIQGFPFFTPAYAPGYEITIYGAEGFGKDLESVFRGQLDREYFPVQMEDMNAALQFRHLAENPVRAGAARVYWEFAQHPGATVGYKIDIGGKKIAWIPDNEFLQGYRGDPAALTRDHPMVIPYGKMIEFLADADLIIHEAQYTNEEYSQKIGWGHSSISNACLLMKFAGARRWIITHHDPTHDDEFLEMKLNLTRQILDRLEHSMLVSHGYDGLTEYF